MNLQTILSKITTWDHIKVVSRLAAVLVAVLAFLAFILSYNSLQHMAQTNGIPGNLSYVWPLLLDFAMVVFSLAILRANLRDEKAYYAWGLTIAFATLATAANVLDVTTLNIPPVVIGAAVKAIAPVALVLSFELLMSMLKAEVRRAAIVNSLASLAEENASALAELDRLAKVTASKNAELLALKSDIFAAKSSNSLKMQALAAESRRQKIEQRRGEVWAMLQEGCSEKEIAESLGIKDVRTIKNDIIALHQVDSTNGNHSDNNEVTA